MELSTTSSSFNATALTTTTTTTAPTTTASTTTVVKKRQRHPAKVDDRSRRTSKASSKNPSKSENPESLKNPKPETSLRTTVPPRHLVNRTFLLPSGEILAPISFFPGSGFGQSRTRWDDAASTMLNMTLVFLKNVPEVIFLFFTSNIWDSLHLLSLLVKTSF